MRLKNPNNGLNRFRVNQALIGPKNNINKIFSTTEKFIYVPGKISPRIEINGNSSYLGIHIKEFSESIIGSGYDTIIFKRAPRIQDELRITYYVT
jgi:hypothetical protein